MNVKRGYLDFSNDICMRWNSTDGLENYLLEADDILIQMDGALIGKSYAKIAEEQLPALLVQRVTRTRTRSKDACTDFMYQTIQRDFLRYIGMNKTETAVPHLSLNDIYNFKIMVPCLEEQQQIGAYFTNLDHLITLHQRKGKAAVSGCFLNCFSLEKSSAQSRTLELFGQISNQEIKYIIDGLSILGGKLRNFCVKLIILLGYTRINDIAKYHISRNTKCVHNIN